MFEVDIVMGAHTELGTRAAAKIIGGLRECVTGFWKHWLQIYCPSRVRCSPLCPSGHPPPHPQQSIMQKKTY